MEVAAQGSTPAAGFWRVPAARAAGRCRGVGGTAIPAGRSNVSLSNNNWRARSLRRADGIGSGNACAVVVPGRASAWDNRSAGHLFRRLDTCRLSQAELLGRAFRETRLDGLAWSRAVHLSSEHLCRHLQPDTYFGRSPATRCTCCACTGGRQADLSMTAPCKTNHYFFLAQAVQR